MDVRKEVIKAYSDCNRFNYGERNLNFRALRAVTVPTAVSIMKDAIGGGYNEFEPELLFELNELFTKPKVVLAREGSVCVYVKGRLKSDLTDTMVARYLTADESDRTPKGYRIWWD